MKRATEQQQGNLNQRCDRRDNRKCAVVTSSCVNPFSPTLIVEDLPHIVTIWTLWQRALSTISFVTVATVHTALIVTKLKPPGAMRLRPRDHDFKLPTVKFEFNKRNFIVRSLFQYV